MNTAQIKAHLSLQFATPVVTLPMIRQLKEDGSNDEFLACWLTGVRVRVVAHEQVIQAMKAGETNIYMKPVEIKAAHTQTNKDGSTKEIAAYSNIMLITSKAVEEEL